MAQSCAEAFRQDVSRGALCHVGPNKTHEFKEDLNDLIQRLVAIIDSAHHKARLITRPHTMESTTLRQMGEIQHTLEASESALDYARSQADCVNTWWSQVRQDPFERPTLTFDHLWTEWIEHVAKLHTEFPNQRDHNLVDRDLWNNPEPAEHDDSLLDVVQEQIAPPREDLLQTDTIEVSFRCNDEYVPPEENELIASLNEACEGDFVKYTVDNLLGALVQLQGETFEGYQLQGICNMQFSEHLTDQDGRGEYTINRRHLFQLELDWTGEPRAYDQTPEETYCIHVDWLTQPPASFAEQTDVIRHDGDVWEENDPAPYMEPICTLVRNIYRKALQSFMLDALDEHGLLTNPREEVALEIPINLQQGWTHRRVVVSWEDYDRGVQSGIKSLPYSSITPPDPDRPRG